MTLKKLKEHEHPLLQRRRISFEAEHVNNATPSKNSLREQIAKQVGVEQKFVAIRHVFTHFGMQKSKVIANIYEDEKNLKFLEPPKGKKAEKKEKAPAK